MADSKRVFFPDGIFVPDLLAFSLPCALAALQVKSSWLWREKYGRLSTSRPAKRFYTVPRVPGHVVAYASRYLVPRSTQATPNLRGTFLRNGLFFEFRRVSYADYFQTCPTGLPRVPGRPFLSHRPGSFRRDCLASPAASPATRCKSRINFCRESQRGRANFRIPCGRASERFN